MSHKKIILVLVKLTIENGRHIEVSIQATGNRSEVQGGPRFLYKEGGIPPTIVSIDSFIHQRVAT